MREVLSRVLDLLGDGWCQNRVAEGGPYDPDTRIFCVFGALCRVLGPEKNGGDEQRRVMDRLNEAARKAGFKGVIHANDAPQMTHERLIAIVTRARDSAP